MPLDFRPRTLYDASRVTAGPLLMSRYDEDYRRKEGMTMAVIASVLRHQRQRRALWLNR
jgi:hypothetical protein